MVDAVDIAPGGMCVMLHSVLAELVVEEVLMRESGGV
jgi:hypothetical protein